MRDSNRLSEIWILCQWVIQIRNSKIRIVLSDLRPSAFTFTKGFEFITQRFELPCLVLYNSKFKDSNRYVRDSNPFFNLYSCFSWGILITEWVIQIDGSQHLFFLHKGFESLDLKFESVDLNNLTRIWIWIASWGIRIAFVSLNFLEFGFKSPFEGFESLSSNLLEKLQNWRVTWGIRIWILKNSSKCSFVKIFLGIFIFIQIGRASCRERVCT